MCPQDRTARRYHWLSENVQSFVNEPHNGIVGDARREIVLNMTAKESEGCRKASVDIAKEQPRRLVRLLISAKPEFQKSLDEWFPKTSNNTRNERFDFLSMPENINWKALEAVYEFQPGNYEQLLGFKGIGPATVRGLALIAELIYGEKPSWQDPVKYSFAYGGKDGVPFPVDRRAMDESIQILRLAIENAKIGEKDRMHSLQRLRRFVPVN